MDNLPNANTPSTTAAKVSMTVLTGWRIDHAAIPPLRTARYPRCFFATHRLDDLTVR